MFVDVNGGCLPQLQCQPPPFAAVGTGGYEMVLWLCAPTLVMLQKVVTGDEKLLTCDDWIICRALCTVTPVTPL